MDFHLISGISKLPNSLVSSGTSDFADRFSHAFSVWLLVIFTVVTSARHYFGQPISCWLPTEFTKSQQDFAEQICWITSTYFVASMDEIMPTNAEIKRNTRISYYQWVPFILLIQAFLFTLPKLIWTLFHWQSGVHLNTIMSVSCDLPSVINDSESYKRNLAYIARHIEDSLTLTAGNFDEPKVCKCLCLFWCSKRRGNFLISLYLVTKLLYTVNVVGQLFLMNKYLGTTYTFYGIDLLRDILNGKTWEESGSFPRITYCDFMVRKFGHNRQQTTVQCVLPINMFNEKIYIFLWFWFLTVACISITSFLTWSCRSSVHSKRLEFVMKHLKLRGIAHYGEKAVSNLFVDRFLRQDGVFILRLIAQNSSELICSQVVEQLWRMFKDKPHSYAMSEVKERPFSRNLHKNHNKESTKHRSKLRDRLKVNNGQEEDPGEFV